MNGDLVETAYVAVGGVGPVPLRLPKVEAALAGKAPTAENFARAASLAADGANPLPQIGYKVPLLNNSVDETLRRAIESFFR